MVLLHILTQLYYFNDNLSADIPEVIGKRNFGVELMAMLGCSDDYDVTKMAIIEGVLNTPITTKQEDTNDE